MALLGEKIAQLFDTAPEPDPENAFDDETIAKNENIDTGINVDTHSSRLRDIDLGDSYKGEVISRDQLNQWDNDDIDDEDIDVEDQDPDSDDTEQPLRVIPTVDSSEDDTDDDIMDEDEFDTVFEKKNDYLSQFNFRDDSKNKHQLSRFGEDNDKFNEDDEEEEEEDDMLNRQIEAVNELTEASKTLTINKTQIRPQTHQIRKAKAVASQTKLYDKVATLRIHIQKPFQIAQKLPRPSTYVELMDNVDGEGGGEKNERKRKLKALLDEVSEKSLSITNNILKLQSKLLDTNEDYPEELRDRKRRKLNNDTSANEQPQFEELWQEMNQDWNEFLPHSNKVMDVWDRKMKLVEDYASKKQKGKLNDHTMLERLALIIDSPHRILNKMQSVDKLFKMYGDTDIKINNEGNIVENEEDEDINKKDERIMEGVDVGRGGNKGLKFEKYRMDYEVFNDSQFYRRMLKEIIDIGHAATFNADEIHRKMDNIQQEKQRQKMAFHKAKLRMKYTIRPDMENFMAPRYDHDPDFPVEQLYNSLFQ